jgi:hypothetical protein
MGHTAYLSRRKHTTPIRGLSRRNNTYTLTKKTKKPKLLQFNNSSDPIEGLQKIVNFADNMDDYLVKSNTLNPGDISTFRDRLYILVSTVNTTLYTELSKFNNDLTGAIDSDKRVSDMMNTFKSIGVLNKN